MAPYKVQDLGQGLGLWVIWEVDQGTKRLVKLEGGKHGRLW